MALYDRLILEVFRRHRDADCQEFEFERDEMGEILDDWGEQVRNLGDVPYTYRSGRRELPDAITSTGNWVIEPRGKGRYAFKRVSRDIYITCPADLKTIPILDATPDIILKYGGTDEQGLLTKIRYNRLVDIFLGITAYHLQGHVRAYIPDSGQVEIDDLYLGVDTEGNKYVIPVEAKTADETLGIVQVVNLNAYAREHFPDLVLRPIAVKSWDDASIFFLEFTTTLDYEKIEVERYKRYKLVRDERLASYPEIARHSGISLEVSSE